MKSRRITTSTIFIGILILNVLLFSVVYQWFFSNCIWWTCAPYRAFTIEELDISEDLFPAESRFGIFGQPSELSGANDAATKTVFWSEGTGQAFYFIERFGMVNTAVETYENSISIFATRVRNDILVQELMLNTGDYEIRCGNEVSSQYKCRFTGLYQEYVVKFSSTIDRKMSQEAFLDIVSIIDQQISCKLNNNCN